ncbi:DDB1- and CUL4-associated factor 13 [Aphelenchoides besseyi]|nr:DDB1- and CUL4-associated factor 13 [Aphelenchoides besseyi]
MAAPDMTAAINSLPKILTNIGPSILNGAIIVSTISGQSLINKLTFTCPCSFPLNEYQSGGFLFGPCIALFMLGVLLNQKTWRLVHGCCYRSRAAQHPLSTSLLYWIQIIAQSLIAPIAWLFVSLLDGSYYRCLMAARFCSNIPNCTGSLNQSVCETCVCSLDKVNSDKLISESQFLAWLLLIFTGISACFVTCCVRSFDKYTYVQNNFVEMYREIEEKIFEETAKTPRNFNSTEDPFRHQVEYTRALNAAKLERVFAKPFLCALDGHNDGVHVLTKHPSRLSTILSGALDGQVKVWTLSNRKCLTTIQAHNGPITGLSVDREDGRTYVSVGQDAQLKLWSLPDVVTGDLSEPLHSIPLTDIPYAISHVSNSSDFATSGDGICIWRVYSIYAFDMRYLSSARMVHKGHTMAAMDVDYAPTGQEFVSGSFDRSLRIFKVDRVKSREVYHAPRMQHVVSVAWSLDNKYVLSGSDEFNIRLWKANAAEKLGTVRFVSSLFERLRDAYQHHPEIGRIIRHRQLPKTIYRAAQEIRTIHDSQRRKKYNRITKTKTGERDVPEREVPILKHGFDEPKPAKLEYEEMEDDDE